MIVEVFALPLPIEVAIAPVRPKVFSDQMYVASVHALVPVVGAASKYLQRGVHAGAAEKNPLGLGET
jgi:hypothetical protein